MKTCLFSLGCIRYLLLRASNQAHRTGEKAV